MLQLLTKSFTRKSMTETYSLGMKMRPLIRSQVSFISTSRCQYSASPVLNEDQREGNRSHIHFKLSPKGKALTPNSKVLDDDCELAAGDHTGRQQVFNLFHECLIPLIESYLDEGRT